MTNIGIAGTRIWLMVEVEFDNNGKATILRSFAKPSANSPVKNKAKVKSKKMNTDANGSETLF